MFSAKAIMVKLGYRYDVDTVTLLLLRMVFALPFYLVIAVRENRKNDTIRLSSKHYWFIVLNEANSYLF